MKQLEQTREPSGIVSSYLNTNFNYSSIISLYYRTVVLCNTVNSEYSILITRLNYKNKQTKQTVGKIPKHIMDICERVSIHL